jgi:hypothetical protein
MAVTKQYRQIPMLIPPRKGDQNGEKLLIGEFWIFRQICRGLANAQIGSSSRSLWWQKLEPAVSKSSLFPFSFFLFLAAPRDTIVYVIGSGIASCVYHCALYNGALNKRGKKSDLASSRTL